MKTGWLEGEGRWKERRQDPKGAQSSRGHPSTLGALGRSSGGWASMLVSPDSGEHSPQLLISQERGGGTSGRRDSVRWVGALYSVI